MKLLIGLLVALVSSSSFAAGKVPTLFTCGGMGPGTAFSVEFGGPRFADNVFLRYVDDDLRPLMLLSERTLKTSEEQLNINLAVGSCEKVENSNVLVKCSLKPNGWARATHGFTKFDELAPNFVQTSQITRPVHVNDIKLEVVKVGTDATLSITMNVDTADQKNMPFYIIRKLATLNQDWYMCKFE